MALDPVIVEQLSRTQLPALALGAAGFAFATQQLRPHTLAAEPSLRSPLRVWHGLGLAACMGVLLVVLALAVKIRIVWPVPSALESVWWVALAAGVGAVLCALLGFGVRGPVQQGVAPHGAAAKATRGGLVIVLSLCLVAFALVLPVATRVASWSAQQQLSRGAAALLLGAAIVAGMLLLVRPSAQSRGFGRIATLSVVVGMAAQMLALDYDSLRLSLIVGGIASFFFVGALVVLARATRDVARTGLLACTLAAGAVLVNVLWQASLFGGASEGSALLYCGAIALALWAGVLGARWSERALAKRPVLRELAPLMASAIVLLPVVGVCVVRSGVLEPAMY
jgi:hypothetical protein